MFGRRRRRSANTRPTLRQRQRLSDWDISLSFLCLSRLFYLSIQYLSVRWTADSILNNIGSKNGVCCCDYERTAACDAGPALNHNLYGGDPVPANTNNFYSIWPDVGPTSSTLSNIAQMLYQCFVFTGDLLGSSKHDTLNQCRFNVYPQSPTSAQH